MHFDQAELQALQRDVVFGFEIETLHHLARQTGLRTGDGEAFTAPRDVHFQRGLDLAQVLVECAAQVRQAGVVHRLKGNWIMNLSHKPSDCHP